MVSRNLGRSFHLGHHRLLRTTCMSKTFVLLASHSFQSPTCSFRSAATIMEFSFHFWQSHFSSGVPNSYLRRAMLLRRIVRVKDLDIKPLMSSSNDCIKQPTANIHHEDFHPSFCGLLCLGAVCRDLRLWKSSVTSTHSRRR